MGTTVTAYNPQAQNPAPVPPAELGPCPYKLHPALADLPEHEQALVALLNGAPSFPEPANWVSFVDLVHRLQLGERLALSAARVNLPGEVRDALRAARQASAGRNLLLAHEETQLLQRFHHAGIIAFPVKGVSLARILHHNPAARSVTDMDLALRGRDVAPAAELLRELGWQVSLPDVLLRRRDFVARADAHTAEVACSRQQAGMELLLELHWNLLPLDEDRLWDSLTDYRMADGGAPVRTLSPELYLLYLCAHVSGHGWRGLRWLCDVADFLQRFAPDLHTSRFADLASQAGLRQRVEVTLELVRFYFAGDGGWPVGPRAQRDARRYIHRPLEAPVAGTPGEVHRERLRLQDNALERLRYALWLARPTHVDWLDETRGEARLRSPLAAWRLRTRRLASMVTRELASNQPAALEHPPEAGR